jgi:DNA-binding NtrC family response regulator
MENGRRPRHLEPGEVTIVVLPPGRLERRRVLILDDDEEVAALMREVIVMGSHVVAVVHDLEAAWQEIITRLPDVLVADYHIGHRHSGQLLALVHCAFPSLFVILVSGSYRTEWSYLLEHGLVHAALQKPFDPIELMQLVGSQRLR